MQNALASLLSLLNVDQNEVLLQVLLGLSIDCI